MIDAVAGERGEPAGRLAELYRRYSGDAIRLAYLLTGDRSLSEDLVQDAFVKMAGLFADLRDPTRFEPYLRKTVVNLARMHFRRSGVERRYLDRAGREPVRPAEQPDV